MHSALHGKRQLSPYYRSAALLLLALVLAATACAQKFSFSLQKVGLETAFRQIEKQSAYRFVYTREMLNDSRPVTLSVKRASLRQVLDLLFESQPLEYRVNDHFIQVRIKSLTAAPSALLLIEGRVVDEEGRALPGVTVRATRSGHTTLTDGAGNFTLVQIIPGELLIFSSIGFEERTVMAGDSPLLVALRVKYNALNETVIMAYGTTTRKLNTGSITRVSGADISKQPVSNPLGALYGRVPGLVITQNSGVPGAGYSLQIRGRNSMAQGSEPLIIIDGVPFAPGNNPINRVANAVGSGAGTGLSALNTLNPSDIESVEILKDADATAIYGSRGANGVVLITTKKGQSGAARIEASLYRGNSRITRTMNMLNTKQYLDMRNEAFRNDGLAPTVGLAPDLLAWDTTRYTDFKKLLIGNTAHTTDAQLRLSGGTAYTRLLLGGSYHRETTVFPGNLGDTKLTTHTNLHHSSTNKRLVLNFSASYSWEKSRLMGADPTAYINLPPNLLLYDSTGRLNWKEGGVSYGLLGLTNPLAATQASYEGQFDNLLANLLASYVVLPGLTLKASGGYNLLTGQEQQLNPSTSIDPARALLPFANFGNSTQRSWIVEPQAEYLKTIGKGKLSFLAGATWQSVLAKGSSIAATEYSSDLLLASMSAAGNLKAFNAYSRYHYNAGFGRVNYNYEDRYLLNISGRRDGSSRFGPNNRFSNFGAIGAAWIFSTTKALKKQLPFISYGKLRASYGLTGNDQIGDYRYLETWTNGGLQPYQGIPGLRPTSLYNPDYEWERNRKLEAALELGFLEDRFFLSAACFRNRSDNQLVNYSLPSQTGFSSVVQNIEATIENSGLEFLLTARLKRGTAFAWSASLTLSAMRNRLVSFPDLEKSSYAQNYVIGQPLSTRKLYRYLGVNPITGIYSFEDVNRDGNFTLADRVVYKHTDPRYYGGLVNTLRYKGLELEFLLEFRRQRGLNYLATQSQYIPGYFYFNQPLLVRNRWQQPNDIRPIQRFAATGASEAFIPASEYLVQSDAIYGDASFLRLRTISLSYALPQSWLQRWHLSGLSCYLRGQNLVTITNYVGADPENQNLYVLPPLQTIVGGFQLNF